MAKKELFGTAYGKPIYAYTISNGILSLTAMELGAAITHLFVPGRDVPAGDIAVGFQNAQDYAAYSDNQGAAIGRYANRIKNGTFVQDGITYHIPCNDGRNALHGNNEFRNAVWNVCESGTDYITFSYVSADGTNGFPGTLTTTVRYGLEGNALVIDYDAVSDQKTPICLTNHLYFNLKHAL